MGTYSLALKPRRVENKQGELVFVVRSIMGLPTGSTSLTLTLSQEVTQEKTQNN
jgi:hypothetical protein